MSDTEEIDDHFKKHKIPINTQSVSGDDSAYYFVESFPYSGVNSVDLYCFVNHGAEWRLHSIIFVKSISDDRLIYRISENTIDILDGEEKIHILKR